MKLSDLKLRLQQSFAGLAVGDVREVLIKNGTGLALIKINLTQTPAGTQFRIVQMCGSREGSSGLYWPMNSVGEMHAYDRAIAFLVRHSNPGKNLLVLLNNWAPERRELYLNEFVIVEDNAEIASVA